MSGGRPSVYRPEYAEIARDCCAAGATNETLAERFTVSRRTVDRWIEGIPDFRDAVSDGRGIANGKVVSALFARAIGLEHKMVKVSCHNGQPVTATYTVEVLPDVRACMFWLRNRLPEQWRENRPLANDTDLPTSAISRKRCRLSAPAMAPPARPAATSTRLPLASPSGSTFICERRPAMRIRAALIGSSLAKIAKTAGSHRAVHPEVHPQDETEASDNSDKSKNGRCP